MEISNYGLYYFAPTPIWYVPKVRENMYDAIQSELDTAYENTNFSGKDKWGKTHLLSDPEFATSLLHKEKCYSLMEEIDYQIFVFLHELGYKSARKYFYESSWFAKFEPGDYAHTHSHSPADLSGVYYYKTSDDHKGLFFDCPNPNLNTSVLLNAPLGRREDPPASQGSMILFPSYIPHGVMTNETNEDRVSVSFNIYFDRDDLAAKT